MKAFHLKSCSACLLAAFQVSMVFAQQTPVPSGIAGSYDLLEFEAPDIDAARIGKLPKKTMSSAELKTFLAASTKKVEGVLPAEMKKMTGVLISKSANSRELAAMANGLWLAGNYAGALMLMGQACVQDPNPDNLNNYSAFLVMLGGEQLALPVLQKLDQDFPGNSTVLNNMAQAWFGLGDMSTASTYLDKTIKANPEHPQANLTKAVIENRAGNQAAAIDALRRSLEAGYSRDKESMLNELGYEDEAGGRRSGRRKQDYASVDTVGFDKIMENTPKFFKTLEQATTGVGQWQAFHDEINQQLVELQAKQQRLADEVRAQANAKISRKRGLGMPFNLARKVRHEQRHDSAEPVTGGNDPDYLVNQTDKINEPMLTYGNAMLKIKDENCAAKRAVANNYLATVNTILEEGFNTHMEAVIRQLKQRAYSILYTASDQLELELAASQIKLEFLLQLKIVHPMPPPLEGDLHCPVVIQPAKPQKLANFDDLNCPNKVSFSVPLTGSYELACGRGEMHLTPLMLPFEAHFTENTDTGEYLNASLSIGKGPLNIKGSADFETGSRRIEAGISQTIGEGYLGPVPLEASASATIGLEIDGNGGCDYFVATGVEAKAGNKAGSVSVESEARWGWNAGPSGAAKASFGGALGKLSQ